jgi:hypothetical protein
MAVDERALAVGLEQDVAGVEIAEPHVPVDALRHDDAAAEVEVEADALGPSWVGTGAGSG